MRLHHSWLSLGLAIVVSGASAQRTYSPAELRRMVDSGKYPAQGTPTTTSEYTSFAVCVSKVESVVASVRPNYPSRTIVSTRAVRVEKLWTNDSAMTLTCSAADNKLVITSASYK
jgi:hypothetical protein